MELQQTQQCCNLLSWSDFLTRSINRFLIWTLGLTMFNLFLRQKTLMIYPVNIRSISSNNKNFFFEISFIIFQWFIVNDVMVNLPAGDPGCPPLHQYFSGSWSKIQVLQLKCVSPPTCTIHKSNNWRTGGFRVCCNILDLRLESLSLGCETQHIDLVISCWFWKKLIKRLPFQNSSTHSDLQFYSYWYLDQNVF